MSMPITYSSQKIFHKEKIKRFEFRWQLITEDQKNKLLVSDDKDLSLDMLEMKYRTKITKCHLDNLEIIHKEIITSITMKFANESDLENLHNDYWDKCYQDTIPVDVKFEKQKELKRHLFAYKKLRSRIFESFCKKYPKIDRPFLDCYKTKITHLIIKNILLNEILKIVCKIHSLLFQIQNYKNPLCDSNREFIGEKELELYPTILKAFIFEKTKRGGQIRNCQHYFAELLYEYLYEESDYNIQVSCQLWVHHISFDIKGELIHKIKIMTPEDIKTSTSDNIRFYDSFFDDYYLHIFRMYLMGKEASVNPIIYRNVLLGIGNGYAQYCFYQAGKKLWKYCQDWKNDRKLRFVPDEVKKLFCKILQMIAKNNNSTTYKNPRDFNEDIFNNCFSNFKSINDNCDLICKKFDKKALVEKNLYNSS